MSCSQLFLDVDVCNLLILVADAFMSLINVDHTCMRKTSFLQNDLLSAISCIVVPCFKTWLLASIFKVLIGLPLVILLARHERTRCKEEYLGDEHAS